MATEPRSALDPTWGLRCLLGGVLMGLGLMVAIFIFMCAFAVGLGIAKFLKLIGLRH